MSPPAQTATAVAPLPGASDKADCVGLVPYLSIIRRTARLCALHEPMLDRGEDRQPEQDEGDRQGVICAERGSCSPGSEAPRAGGPRAERFVRHYRLRHGRGCPAIGRSPGEGDQACRLRHMPCDSHRSGKLGRSLWREAHNPHEAPLRDGTAPHSHSIVPGGFEVTS
jgi:hypothetical protein